MSHLQVSAVKARSFGSTSRKAVALVLADYCDAAWSCWVGQARLAAEAEVGERTLRRVLAAFEDEGLIRRERRVDPHGHRTSDRIVLIREAVEALPAKSTGGLPDSVAAGLPATDDRLPATEYRPTGQSLADKKDIEPSEELPMRAEARTLTLVVPDAPDRFVEFWEAYPSTRSKADARKAWAKAVKRDTPDRIIEGARRYRDDPTRNPDATKYAQGWLSGDRWRDYDETEADSRDPYTGVVNR